MTNFLRVEQLGYYIQLYLKHRMSVTDSAILRLHGLQNHQNGSTQVSASVSIQQSVADRYSQTLWRTEGKPVGGHVLVILDTKKSQYDGGCHGYPLADPLADHCILPGLLHPLTDTSATDIC